MPLDTLCQLSINPATLESTVWLLYAFPEDTTKSVLLLGPGFNRTKVPMDGVRTLLCATPEALPFRLSFSCLSNVEVVHSYALYRKEPAAMELLMERLEVPSHLRYPKFDPYDL